MRSIDAGEPITRFGDGTSRRDYTYVDDTVAGFEAALDRVFDFEIINLGEARTVSLAELIEAVEVVMGKHATVEEKPWRGADVHETYADITQARRLLGYEPKFSLEQGLREFWSWYEAHREVLRAAGGPSR